MQTTKKRLKNSQERTDIILRNHKKIIGRVSAVTLALIIALSSLVTGFAAVNTNGYRYSQYWGIKWKNAISYSYTDSQGDSVSGTMGASLGRFNVHYFAQNGQSINKFAYAQRAFCIEPEKYTESPTEYNTPRDYSYTGSANSTYPLADTTKYISYLSRTGLSAYDDRLSPLKKQLLTYVLANGYGNYVKPDSTHVAYWYATQLLVYETIIGWRDSNFNAPYHSFEPNACLTVESHSDVPTSNHAPETAVANIQKAYLDIVGWVKLTLKNPDGTSESSSNCPTYKMTYSQGLGKYYYDYSFNDIIRQNLVKTAGYTDQLPELNLKASDIIVYDSGSQVKVSYTIDKANKRIRFTTDKPLSGSIAIAFHNPRIRGINTALTKSTGGAGLMVVNTEGKSYNQVFARGAAPLIDRPAYFKLTTENTMKLKMKKVSANPELTKDNSCYSFEGAVYGIYSDAKCEHLTGQMITDADGNASWNNGGILPYYAAWAKELKAPKGYRLDENIYQFEYQGKEDGVSVYSFTSTEIPDNDPITVFLQKKNAITGQSGADLSGAVFKVCFYDGEYSDAADVQGLTALRTWYFETDENGKVTYGNSYLAKDTVTYPSDALYIFDGEPALPNGSLSVQEVKAPTNYKVNPDIYVDTVKDLGEYTEDQEPVNPFVVNEVPVGGLTIQKTSSDNIVKDVWFRVQGDTGYQGGYNKVFKTNEDGFIAIKDDPDMYVTDGNGQPVVYTITELGFANGDGTYTIPARYTPDHISQTTTIDEEGGVTVKFKNQMPTGLLAIDKDAEDGYVSSVYFQVTGTNGYSQRVSTNTHGTVYVRNLPVYDENDNLVTYTVKELGMKVGSNYRVPERYETVDKKYVTFANATINSNNLIRVHFENNLKYGSLKINKAADDGDINGIYFRVENNYADKSDDLFYVNEIVKTTDGVAELSYLPVFDDNDMKLTYTVTELGKKVGDNEYKVPGYYYEVEPQNVKLDATSTEPKEVSFENKVKSMNLLVTKTATDDKIENVYFRIESSDGEINDVYSTNEFGEIYIEDLYCVNEDGESVTYTITELGIKMPNGGYMVPARYYEVEPQVVEGINYVPATPEDVQDAEVDFYNTEKEASILIRKTSEDNFVSNIWFRLTAQYNNTSINQVAMTGSNGEGGFDKLKVYDDNGNKIVYTVTELGEKQSDGTYSIPYRYNSIQPKTLTLDYDEQGDIYYNEVDFENTLKKGSATVVKMDEHDDPLANVVFELHKSDGTLVDTKTTTSNGRAVFSNLDQGNYYIVETKTVAGFNLLKDKIDVTVSGESNETLNVTVNVKETLNFKLPNTGENGILSLCIGGGVILIAGIAIIVFIKMKKKK